MDSTAFEQFLKKHGRMRRRLPGKGPEEGFDDIYWEPTLPPASCPNCEDPNNHHMSYEWKHNRTPPFWRIKCERCRTRWSRYKED
jgi:hypothetical protein